MHACKLRNNERDRHLIVNIAQKDLVRPNSFEICSSNPFTADVTFDVSVDDIADDPRRSCC